MGWTKGLEEIDLEYLMYYCCAEFGNIQNVLGNKPSDYQIQILSGSLQAADDDPSRSYTISQSISVY